MKNINSSLPKQPSQEDILVARAREDLAAFAGLYDLYVQPVYRYLLSKLGNVQDAEDLTGQTFLAAIQNFPRYKHKGKFAAWLFSIARNKATDFYRKEGSQHKYTEAAAALSDHLDDLTALKTERQIDLAELIHALPEKDQELLRLRFVAQMKFKEIAALTGKNVGAVKKATYRLLEKLEIQLEDYRD
jgi:RNA polymerase sigma-70 factor (ECF subfamily)